MTVSPDGPARDDLSISVLVPALNEERGLEPTVTQLLEILPAVVRSFEILIVNDGSVDGTAAAAERLAQRDPTRVRAFHNAVNMGLGFSYLHGVREARMTHFVFIPGDNSWPSASVLRILGHLGEADVVTSHATNPDCRVGYRRLLSSVFTYSVNALFGFKMKYYNGLTVYPRRFLLDHPATTHGFGFQAETLLRALAAGLSVVEVGAPIDESSGQRSKAITARNMTSVAKTIACTYWDLRVRRSRPLPYRHG
jgi:glycosyltransferase involved in cell wall biosynthesis